MQSLTEISIRNFRSCRDLPSVPLADFTPIVGYNNAGKSNVLAAIRWVLRRSVLEREDFFDPSEAVWVDAVITGIDATALSLLEERHALRIRPFLDNGCLRIRRLQPSPRCNPGEIRLKVFGPSKSALDPESWNDNPAGIDNAIALLFPEPIDIAAMDDLTKDIGKYESGSTIGKLLAQLMTTVRSARAGEIQERVGELRKLFESDGADRASEFAEFDVRANSILSEFFPGVAVKVHIPAPELPMLFKGGSLRVFDLSARTEEPESEGRDVASLGHGAQRAVQMSLIKLLADSSASNVSGRTLLLVDEPELHMHPQAIVRVRAALRKLADGPYQVVVSTHSPMMIGRKDIGTAVMLHKSEVGETLVRKSLGGASNSLEAEKGAQLDELFSVASAAEILFSNRVILVEGKTERELLPELFETCLGFDLGLRQLGLVELRGSGNIPKCLDILRAAAIPVRALADLDFAFAHAVSAGLLQPEDPDLVLCVACLAQVEKQITSSRHGACKFDRQKRREEIERMAQSDPTRSAIERLHQRLKERDVWLWTGGSIEHHLGMRRKNRLAIEEMRTRLRSSGSQAVRDLDEVVACLRWLSAE